MPNSSKFSDESEKESDELDPDGEKTAEVRSAREVLQYIAKTTKTLKIYLSNNPIHQKFLSELREKFNTHFEKFGPLRLKIRQFELLCRGATVYENINRMESLAFHLFVDGIREVTFQEGLTPEEIVRFLEIIGRESDRSPDDDTVTLLWEKNFIHIRYTVVEDLLGRPDLSPIGERKEPDGESRGESQIRTMLEQEAGQGEYPPAQGASVASSETEFKRLEIPDLSIFQLSEEEIGLVKREVEREDEADLVQKLLEILFDILRIEREPVLFSEVVGIVDNILNSLMMRGDFQHARHILEFYWEMTDPVKSLPTVLTGRLTEAIQKAGDPGRIRGLESVLNSEGFIDTENFFAFLILLEKNVVAPLADLMGHTSRMRVRRLLCDALIELGKMDLEAIVAKLDCENWYVVRNLVYVLGKIGDPRVIEAFQRVVRHPEVRVRKELVLALETIPDARIVHLLALLIEDPDGGVRTAALKIVTKRNIKQVQEILLKVIDRESFAARDLEEKREFFDTLGRISGDEVVATIGRLLFQKNGFLWFKNPQREEMGVCAVMTLQRIGTPGALALLEKGAKHSSGGVRDACARALELLG